MKGLLIKEFYNTKYYIIIYGIIMILYMFIFGVINIITVDPSEMTPTLFINQFIVVYYLTIIFSFSFLQISQQIDESTNFTRFILTTGVTRKKLIDSKLAYGSIFSGGFSLFYLIFYFVFLFVATTFDGSTLAYMSIYGIVSIILGNFFNLGLTLFLTVVFDSVKVRVITSLSSIVISTILALFTMFGPIYLEAGEILAANLLTFISFGVLGLLGGLFIFLSYKVFNNKDIN